MDSKSYADMVFYDAFLKLRINNAQFTLMNNTLVGFTNSQISRRCFATLFRFIPTTSYKVEKVFGD